MLGGMPLGGGAGKSGRAGASRLCGLAAFLGGAAWTGKGVAILMTGDQPPLLFEIAPALFGSGLFGAGFSTMSPGRRRSATLGLAAVAAIAGLVALLVDRAGQVNPAIAVSSLALLVGLWTLPRRAGWPAPLAWWMGAALVPALLVGGVLAEVDERLLEVPLTCLGIAWMALGWAMIRLRR